MPLGAQRGVEETQKCLRSCRVFESDHICTDDSEFNNRHFAAVELVFFFCCPTTKHGFLSYVIFCVIGPGFNA